MSLIMEKIDKAKTPEIQEKIACQNPILVLGATFLGAHLVHGIKVTEQVKDNLEIQS